MRARTWAIFIIVNVIVSATVMLTILFIWGRTHTAPAPTPTLTLSAAAPSPVATDAGAGSPTDAPTAPPTSSDPLLYTVQEGDTLGAIAQLYGLSVEDLMAVNNLSDPNTIHPGQALVISTAPPPSPTSATPAETPSNPSPTDEGLPTPLPSLTPSGPAQVGIAQVLGSGNLAAEMVIVRNRGGAATLEGWTLSGAEDHTFTFPAITLFTDAEVRLHSTAGSSTPSDLYWGRTSPAWTGGALITLRDAAGNVVDTYIVP